METGNVSKRQLEKNTQGHQYMFVRIFYRDTRRDKHQLLRKCESFSVSRGINLYRYD